jgi:hypothetical protein
LSDECCYFSAHSDDVPGLLEKTIALDYDVTGSMENWTAFLSFPSFFRRGAGGSNYSAPLLIILNPGKIVLIFP